MAHSPLDDKGRERYFFLAFPHISVDSLAQGLRASPGMARAMRNKEGPNPT